MKKRGKGKQNKSSQKRGGREGIRPCARGKTGEGEGRERGRKKKEEDIVLL